MATKDFKLAVFAWTHGPGFSPAGLLTVSETVGANPQNRELTSRFAYGLRYLERADAIEVDPVSLSLDDRDTIKGRELFPVNGLGEFGGIRDAAPDAWGRRVIEARRKVPANTLSEAEYLLAAGGALPNIGGLGGLRHDQSDTGTLSVILGHEGRRRAIGVCTTACHRCHYQTIPNG